MKFNNTPNRNIWIDGKEEWISRSVAVLGVLLFCQGDRTYVPLGLRGPALPDESGKWGLPGGYLDYDETASEAMIREVWEELGLNLLALQTQYPFHGSLDQPYYVFSQPVRRQNVTLRYPLRFDLGTDELPQLDPKVGADEVVETEWVELEAALAMDLAFGHQNVIRQCLEMYYQPRLGLVIPG